MCWTKKYADFNISLHQKSIDEWQKYRNFQSSLTSPSLLTESKQTDQEQD